MWFYICLVCFVINLDVVICKNENLQTLSITLNGIGQNCCVTSNHHFYYNDMIQFDVHNNMILPNKTGKYIIQLIHWYINDSKQPNPTLKTFVDQKMVKNFSGIWRFEFLYLKDVAPLTNLDFTKCKNHSYIRSVCSTNVDIAIKTVTSSKELIAELDEKWIIIGSIIIVFIAMVMISQTVALVYYRSKVRKLNMHNNLVQNSNGRCQDNDRYSTNPIQKNKLIEPASYPRDSEIYEVPDITLADSARPERIPTSSVVIPPSPSVAKLRSSASSQMTLSRAPIDQDTLARRPPLPLPTDVYYSEAIEENMYEPPPAKEAPTTKVPPHKLFGKQLPDLPKPGILPNPHLQPLKPTKPQINQSKPTPPRNKVSDSKPVVSRNNNLKPTLPRNINESKPVLPTNPVTTAKQLAIELKSTTGRNQAVQLPVRSIPGPSMKTTSKPKPMIATPKTPMATPKKQQGKLLENHQAIHNGDSSDEDWTYEALPQYNIYSI